MNYQPVHSAPPRAQGRKPNRMVIALGAVAVAGLVVTAALVTQNDTTSAPPATAGATAPVTTATHKPTSATALRSYLKANFADATWYPKVRKVELLNGAPWITTRLTSSAAARPVCSAASAWA